MNPKFTWPIITSDTSCGRTEARSIASRITNDPNSLALNEDSFPLKHPKHRCLAVKFNQLKNVAKVETNLLQFLQLQLYRRPCFRIN